MLKGANILLTASFFYLSECIHTIFRLKTFMPWPLITVTISKVIDAKYMDIIVIIIIFDNELWAPKQMMNGRPI